ncbi:hypothetical protein DPEC_G00018690 [Dallia pectoralis]|uniref:Uncharacterized protein n=1 Tax=Dallia pectoralis TaxID=75939 RepID=A0ACC2HFH3_DALPE|nr:hypothetical protein DPEC_G00018690 [Dallia pectoralis]
MKVFERLMLQHLRPLVRDHIDPLQFAYQPRLGVEDAIIFMLHRAYLHLERAGSMVRIMFFDFSGAFYIIQPLLLARKLSVMQVDQDIVAITDYLTDRLKFVHLQSSRSDVAVSNTGSPQGTVLSPFLFTLYTSDFRHNSGTCHLQKFADDSSIMGYITADNYEEYSGLVQSFVRWSEANYMQLNTSKTKELVVEFRGNKKPLTPITIQGNEGRWWRRTSIWACTSTTNWAGQTTQRPYTKKDSADCSS